MTRRENVSDKERERYVAVERDARRFAWWCLAVLVAIMVAVVVFLILR